MNWTVSASLSQHKTLAFALIWREEGCTITTGIHILSKKLEVRNEERASSHVGMAMEARCYMYEKLLDSYTKQE
jgi:hypothetical protein